MQTLTGFSKFALVAGIASVLGAVGCGSGGSAVIIHSQGNFSNSTLNGSYVYQIHGVGLLNGNTFTPYREAGVFTADGSGHVTAGTDDSSFSSAGTPVTGSYNIASDGTGTISFNNSSLGVPLNFAITVSSSSQVQMIENDNALNGTQATLNAGGIAELQDSTAASVAPNGTFVFRLHQEQSAQNSAEEAIQVGGFAVASGTGSGAMDEDFNGTLSSPAITVAFNTPVAAGRGTAALTDTSANFTTNLVYYVVNSGELALLVDNSGAVGSGGAEVQSGITSSTGLSGAFAFGSRGDDLNTGVDGVATAGVFTATSGSLSGTEDVMQDGTYTASTSFPSTCYNVGPAGGINGRVVATSGSGAPCSGTTTQIFWMVSPSRAFFLNNSGLIFQDGTADLQTTSSFSAATFKGQFALTMDGVDLVDRQLLARVGALQFDGTTSVTLGEDANGTFSGITQQALSGTYTVGSSGRVVMTLNSGALNLVMYAVSGSKAYGIQQDAGFITSGTALLQ